MTDSYHYSAKFQEEAVLSDGTRVQIRLVQPSDKDMLMHGFERLSSESRYRRFLSVKTSLTPVELCYLTEIDGINHFAVGALYQPPEGPSEGLGLARFVRLADDPDTAEPAIAVIDDAQGKGLGRILLFHLVAAALERGIKRFRCDMYSLNQPMRALIQELAADASIVSDGEILRIEMALSPWPADDRPEVPARPHPLRRLLALAARELLFLPRSVSRPVSSSPEQSKEDS